MFENSQRHFDNRKTTYQNNLLLNAENKLGLGPVAMSKAMGVSYDTYKNWRSARTEMPAVAHRCIKLLLMYPRTAKRLGTE